ncbi:MAG TPA: translocation/assembly module TamB domain-containing protein [Terriglobales bacterium]|nr:translocation/assembly module TamB domain-containing protein [Terriglobales bacterium]
MLLWTGIALAALVLLVFIGIQFILHSNTAHQYILNKAQQSATDALGSDVKVGHYSLTFSGISPTLDLYNVVIAGADPYPNPPLLQVDHIRVGVQVVSALQKKWYLNDVVVNHPVVRVFVDKEGKDNLPQTKKNKDKKSNTDLFALGVRHAVLDRGEVYYNNRKSIMQADLHDLDFRAAFDTSNPRYYGTLAYSNGHLQMESFDTINHNFRAEFEYAPDRVALTNAVLRSGPSHFTVNATLRDFANPKIEAEYTALIDSGEFRQILKNPTLPVGLIDVNGKVQYVAQPNRPMLDVITVEGSLASRGLQLRTPTVRTEVRNIGANYILRNGNVEVRNLHANVLGGDLNGTLTMRDISGASKSQLSATLRSVSLAGLKTAISNPAIQKVGLSGSVNAKANATWGKTFNDLVANADATLNANVAPSQTSPNKVPVDGVVHARYSAPGNTITLTNSYLRMPQTSVNLNGTVSDRSSLQVNLQANDLHQLETIAAMFQTQPKPLGLYGTASFNGNVTGSTSAPRLNGQLVAANLKVKGTEWRSLRTSVSASPSQIALRNGSITPIPRGQIEFDLNAGLHNWGFTPNSPFEVRLNGRQLDVAKLSQAAGLTRPVTGILNVSVQAHGTQLSPIGNGSIDLSQAKVAGETIQRASVKFEGTGDSIRTNLDLRLPAGSAKGTVDYFPKQQGYDARLEANGIRLDQLQSLKSRNMELAGVLNLNASGKGTLKDPQLVAKAEIPKLTVQGQTFDGITLNTNVANHVANVALDSRVLNTTLTGRAKINLTGDYFTEATLNTASIPLQPIIAIYAPSQAANLTGQTELHATLRGPLKNKTAIEAHLTIPTLAVNYRNAVQIGLPQPLRADYTNGVLNIQRTAIRGTGTDLQLQGSVPVVQASAPMSVLLVGTVDLRLAQILNPDLASSGQLVFDINSYGRRADPNIQGQIRIVNAAFATGDAPLGLQNGNGVINVTHNRLEISRFNGTVGGGTVQARGGVTYRPTIGFDLALNAKEIRLLYPDGVRSGLSTNMTLTGTPETAYLRGQVNVDQVSFTPAFDLMGLMGQFGGATTPPPAQGFTSNLQLDLGIHTPQGINLSSRELSLSGGLNLNVRGTAAEPVVLGRVNLTNGDLIFRGNRYLLEGATVDFVNPTRTQPVLNASINTTIQQYNIAMRFEGPIDRMRTSYTSDPALPPADIINLVAFGKTTEAAAANPNPPGSLGAQSAIASAVAGQVTSRLEKVAGISHLSVDPTLGGTGSGGQENPGATVTIQQRVTSKFFVTFSTDVTSTQRQVIQLEYQVSPRMSVSGTRDQNGGFAMDTKFKKRW